MEYDLTALREAADEACAEAFLARDRIDGAVNWADLSCFSAERCESDDGTTLYRVFLAEVAPDATELQTFVRKHLRAAGFEGVEVMTEW